MTESIQSFNTVEAKLVEVFEAIFQKNEVLAAYSAELDKRLGALNEQILSLQKAITGLTEAKKEFDEHQTLVQNSESQFSLGLDNLSAELLSCTTVIGTVTKELDKSTGDSPKLTLVKSDLNHCETSLTQLTEAFAEQLKIATTQSKQCSTMQLTIDTARSGISSATQLLDEQLALEDEDRDEISRVLALSKEMNERALRALATRKGGAAPIERMTLSLVPTM